MPPYYIGGGGNPFSGFGGGGLSGKPVIGPGSPLTGGTPPGKIGPTGGGGGLPVVTGPLSSGGTPATPPAPGSVLGPQAIRASGPSQGYDPAYLQNLATAIGGLFSNRSGGTMNINPLGNLSEISPSSGQIGNAPLPGLPSTWLQDALNGLGFSFGAPAAPVATGPTNPANNGGTGTQRGGGGNVPMYPAPY